MSVTVTEPVNIELLKERFPSETISPYGEVLIIPSRLFQRGWEAELKNQGCNVYANNYDGEACFFVRLTKPKNNFSSETQVTPPLKGKKRPWTLEEENKLKEMVEKGLTHSEIGKALGRTRISVMGKVQRMGLVGFEHTATDAPREAVTITAPNPVISGDDNLIKEYLTCVGELYPRYRNVCVLLLKEATSKMEEQNEHI